MLTSLLLNTNCLYRFVHAHTHTFVLPTGLIKGKVDEQVSLSVMLHVGSLLYFILFFKYYFLNYFVRLSFYRFFILTDRVKF